jgi:hypothetical protein
MREPSAHRSHRVATAVLFLGLTAAAFGTAAGPLATPAHAAEVFVAPNGNDAADGSAEKPLATLQAGVSRLAPGDTLVVRGGTYRETVVFPRSGTAGQPITVRPHPGEKVVISGCDPVGGWQLYDADKNIWRAPMDWTLGTGRNQVFVGGRLTIEARHPNEPAKDLGMYVSDLSPLWPTFGEFSIPPETRKERPGRVTSQLLAGQPAVHWMGAIYYGVHYEGWCGQTGTVEQSSDGEMEVGDRTQGWWFGAINDAGYPSDHQLGRGMLVGHINALDRPGEWHWQDNTLLLIPPAGVDPATVATMAIEAKKRQVALDVSGREHIRIEGLHVVAASMRLEDSAHCTVDGCHFSHLSHFTRQYGIGQVEKGRNTITSGETGIFLSGRGNAFLNCSFRVTAGTGIHLRGYGHTVHNCLFDEVSYTAHYLNAITDAVSDFPDYENRLVGGHTITFNTMRNAGRHFFNFYGNGPSLQSRDRGPMDYAATLFAHNHLSNGMLQTRDAGFITGFFSSGGTLNGLRSQLIYNVMHDCYDISAMHWNVLGMVYLDNGSCDVSVRNNLFWAAPGSLQRDIWFNPPNVNVTVRNNRFHGLFTRTSADLTAEDFPHGKPFRFGHDFEHPPTRPKWPQLVSQAIPAGQAAEHSAVVVKTSGGLEGFKDGDWFSLGSVECGSTKADRWQSVVVRLASDATPMNTDRSGRGQPRHQKSTDPLVLEAAAANRLEGVTNSWHVYRVANGGWLRYDKVPLAAGYRRLRAVYGTTGTAPRSIQVRLDAPDGPLVGTVPLTVTDIPRGGSIQLFREATGEIAESATGTRDVYLRFVSEDGSPVAEVEYFRFEQYRGAIPLAKNDVRLELRAGSRDGHLLGELFPRATGGKDRFNEFVARLEPSSGIQPLFLVVRSALDGPLGTIESVRLERAASPIDETGVGVPPREGPHGPVFPAATNRPCDRPADRYAAEPKDRPFTVATRFRPAAAGGPAVAVDGTLSEWKARGITLSRSLEGAAMPDHTGTCWFGQDDEALYVAVRAPACAASGTAPARPSGEHRWPDDDAVEIVVQDRFATPAGPIITFRGWTDGHFERPAVAELPAEKAAAVVGQITYKASREEDGKGWSCEWRIPFASLGIAPDREPFLAANATVRAASCDAWRSWRINGGATYDLHNGGIVAFPAADLSLSSELRGGLQVWLDAADAGTIDRDDAGLVATWKDKSGHDRHAVQTDAKHRPRFTADGFSGKEGVTFEGGRATRLTLPDLADGPTDVTAFVAFTNPPNARQPSLSARLLTGSDGKEYDYLVGFDVTIPGQETGGPRQMMIERRNRWAKSVRVGCFSPNYQTFFDGTIAEILVFNRLLSGAEKAAVMAYLAAKWDLE